MTTSEDMLFIYMTSYNELIYLLTSLTVTAEQTRPFVKVEAHKTTGQNKIKSTYILTNIPVKLIFACMHSSVVFHGKHARCWHDIATTINKFILSTKPRGRRLKAK